MNKQFLTPVGNAHNYDTPSMWVVKTSIERGFEASTPTEEYEDGKFEW